MNYFPNIEKLNAIIKVLLSDNSNTKSKLEYLIHDYLIEDYKVFDKSVDYWITTNMITTTLLSKDFQKLIKKQSPNFVTKKVDEVFVSTFLQRSSEQPKNKIPLDTMNPDLQDDESFRKVCE
jgi:hypothetical protein